MSFVLNKNNNKILTPFGWQYFYGIQKLQKECLKIILEHNIEIEVSINHRFVIDNVNIIAHELQIDDFLQHRIYGKIKILDIQLIGIQDVYDLIDVNGKSIYYGNDLLNHNCDFLGSTYTLVEPQTLQRLLLETNKDPELIDLAGRLRVYEQPLENTSYIIGVDPAKGTGQHDSVIQILKVISIDPAIQLEQVAVFQNNKTDTYSFARVLNRLSVFYNNALIIIENNGEGSAVVHHLWWTLENQNMYCESQTSTGLGLRATQRTKTKAVLLMKKFLEEKKLRLRDKETARQLATFIEKDNGAFSGQDGVPDDLVSGLYWACYALELDIFDDQAKIIDMENSDDDVWGILSDVDDFNDDMSWV